MPTLLLPDRGLRPRTGRLVAVAALGLTVAALPATNVSAGAAGTTGSYIVVFDNSVNDPARTARAQAARAGGKVQFVYTHALRGYALTVPDAAVPGLSRAPGVAYVAFDRQFTTGPARPQAPAEPDPVWRPGFCSTPTTQPQCLPYGIDRIEADRSSARAGDGRGAVDVDIAVLDTGIDGSHPDLNVAGAVNCSKAKTADDYAGHGTHVAGIAAARDNDLGVVGVAPGARLWNAKVLGDNGVGNTSNILCGVDWVTARASTIEVVNMSLGQTTKDADDNNCGRTNKDPLHQAICSSVAAGVTYVAAAGNESTDSAHSTPAAYDEVITVSAMADTDGQPGALGPPDVCVTNGIPDDTFAFFSNYGADVDLIAPGVCINSTWSRLAPVGPKKRIADYLASDGTSMASPHAAGAGALYLSMHPGATPATVRQALVAAGAANWETDTDPDGTHEPVVDVNRF